MTLNPTKIEWVDFSWNPVTGCQHGCSYCYARKQTERLGRSFKPTFYPDRLSDPIRHRNSASIFVCSMGDLFGDWVNTLWLSDVFLTIDKCKQHTFLLLTKNPARMDSWAWGRLNCYFGATVTGINDQHRITDITRLDTDKTYLSFEPLLGDPKGINLDGISQIIIGAQTRPDIPVPVKWIETLEKEADRVSAKVFVKDSLASLTNKPPYAPLFRRELQWQINK